MDPQDNILTQETLLEHSVWLRGLANQLIRDPGAAEDLVQDTWLAALRARPDPSRPLRPWLARVMRNGAAQRLRKAAGRLARESEVAQSEAIPSARELVERAEYQRFLVDAVLALPEPYREVVLLRFYEGLTPKQIAASLKVPAATVRTRLHRGIGKLRESLDSSQGGNRQAWVLMLQPLGGPVAPATASAPWVLGVVAGMVLLLASLGWAWKESSTPMPETVLVEETSTLNGSSPLVDPSGLASLRDSGASATAASKESRRIRLTHSRTGEPLAWYGVRGAGRSLSSDAEGWVEISAQANAVELFDDERMAVSVEVQHRPRRTLPLEARKRGIVPGNGAVVLPVSVGPTYVLDLTSPMVLRWEELEVSLESSVSREWPLAPVRVPVESQGKAWVRFAEVPKGVVGQGQNQGWKLVVRHKSGVMMGQVPVSDVVDGMALPLPLNLRLVSKLDGVIEGDLAKEGVRISLRMTSPASGGIEGVIRWSVPGPDGVFSVAHLEPGTYDMEVSALLCLTWSDTIEVEPGQGLHRRVPLKVAPVSGQLAGVIRSQSGKYARQLLVFLSDSSGRVVGVYPTSWEPHDLHGSVAPFSFDAAPQGVLRLDVVSLADEFAVEVDPMEIRAPNEEIQILLQDEVVSCDWTFEVVDAETNERVNELDVRYSTQGALARRFMGSVGDPDGSGSAWHWTRNVGGMRWNKFSGPAPLVGLSTDAQFNWSVRAEGYVPQSGDQTHFEGGDGEPKVAKIQLVPMASESKKSD